MYFKCIFLFFNEFWKIICIIFFCSCQDKIQICWDFSWESRDHWICSMCLWVSLLSNLSSLIYVFKFVHGHICLCADVQLEKAVEFVNLCWTNAFLVRFTCGTCWIRKRVCFSLQHYAYSSLLSYNVILCAW